MASPSAPQPVYSKAVTSRKGRRGAQNGYYARRGVPLKVSVNSDGNINLQFDNQTKIWEVAWLTEAQRNALLTSSNPLKIWNRFYAAYKQANGFPNWGQSFVNKNARSYFTGVAPFFPDPPST